MTYAHCGRENRPVRRFCAECGRGLEIRCAGCGARNEHEERFCVRKTARRAGLVTRAPFLSTTAVNK